MQISFFEEFPTKKDLGMIKFVNFPTKLYIGARNLKEFDKVKVKSKFVKENIYWPILSQKEGYWFSPFSQRKALKRTFKELSKSNVAIMWDAELPTKQNPFLYITQLPFFFSNRKLIRNFISKRKDIYTAEYFPSSNFSERLFSFLGLNFRSKNHKPIRMIYSSMHDFGETLIRSEIQSAKRLYGKRLCVALGTLTHCILGTEPSISLEKLERDLQICKEEGVKEVILFRLGGMNKEYQKLLKRYSS
jgi:hypothetical protein